jgi:hypothetical protein
VTVELVESDPREALDEGLAVIRKLSDHFAVGVAKVIVAVRKPNGSGHRALDLSVVGIMDLVFDLY